MGNLTPAPEPETRPSTLSMIRQKKLVLIFVDICGSTRLYEELGDADARARIQHILDALQEKAAAVGGRVIKEIGDESMIAFEGMGDAWAFVQELPDIQQAGDMQCKTGIHSGHVIVENGDVFGDAVNTAARIVSLAAPGRVLLSRNALEALPEAERPQVRALPPTASRGKRAMPDLFEVLDEGVEHTQALDGPQLDSLRRSLASGLRLSWSGGQLELSPGCDEVTLGRGTENTVVLALPRVSRTHLRIESRGPQWLIHDQSTNGTLLREEGAQPVMLRRDQSRLAGRGTLELAPSVSGDSDACVHYELMCD